MRTSVCPKLNEIIFANLVPMASHRRSRYPN